MSLEREHGKMIKNTYAAAYGNERRQHEKVFQRNMRRTGDAFDPVQPVEMSGDNMRKFFRGICGVLATLLTLCILLMAAGLMGVRAFGITPYVVPADMEGLPWSAGALLYVRQEQPETLQPGDTIAYVTDSDLSLEGGVIGSVDTERRFFYVEGAPVYWDNVLGQPLWGIDGLGYVSGYISRPPGLYLVLGAAVVLALLCIFPLRRRKGEKTEESPTGRCMATNAGEKAPTESVQAAAMEEEVPTLTEKPAAEVQRPAETGRRQTSGKRDEAVARHGGKRLRR